MPLPSSEGSPPRATVLVVDDHPPILRQLELGLRAAGYAPLTASSGEEALAVLRAQAVDVVLTDLVMPGLTGLDLLAALEALDPSPPVIILTGEATLENALAALRQGRAFDFLQKPLIDFAPLYDALEKASRLARRRHPPVALLARLSPREREILQLLRQGLDNREIAARACLGENSVRNYLSRIYTKLGVANRSQAIVLSQSLGLE